MHIIFLATLLTIPTVSDRSFDIVQEAWVIDQLDAHDPRRRLDNVTDRRTACLLRMLGCEHGDCRVTAVDLLIHEVETTGRKAHLRIPLLWATRHKDAEIRHLSKGLFDKFFPACKACDGVGWSDPEHEWLHVSRPCFSCSMVGYEQ